MCKYEWCESRAGRNIQERKKHREEEKTRELIRGRKEIKETIW